MNIERRVSGWIYLIVFFVFFYFIQRNVPYQVDDYLFQLAKGINTDGNAYYTNGKIGSVKELWDSIILHREIGNGRVSDVFVMCNAYFFGLKGFAVINSLIVTLFIAVCAKLGFKKITLTSVAAATLAAAALLPVVPRTVLWMSGACNYLWGGFAFCLFLLAYSRYKEGESNLFVKVSCVFLALVTSSVHEALGLSLTAMLVLEFGFQYVKSKQMPTITFFVIIAASITGIMVPLTADGLYNRIDTAAGSQLSEKIKLVCVTVLGTMPAALVYAACMYKLKKKALTNCLTYFSTVNLLGVFCIGVLAGGSGAWGGNRYYLCLGVLILFLQTFCLYIEKYKKAVAIIFILSAPAWWYSNYKLYNKAAEIHEYVSRSKVAGHVLVVDTSDWPECTEEATLFHSLPHHLLKNGSMGLILKGKPFVVTYKSFETNSSLYEKYRHAEAEQSCVFYDNNLCYIRLPKGITCFERRGIEVESLESGEKGLIYPYVTTGSPYQILFCMYNRFVNKYKYMKRMCCDHDGIYSYVIIKDLPKGKYKLKVPTYDSRTPQNITIMELEIDSHAN